MESRQLPRLLAPADLAERWNTTSQVINNWSNRHRDFPQPIARVQRNKVPLFTEDDVRIYEQKKGLAK